MFLTEELWLVDKHKSGYWVIYGCVLLRISGKQRKQVFHSDSAAQNTFEAIKNHGKPAKKS
jgi:hypothetical protein